MAEAATKKYVATEEGGKVASRRFHLYDNCSTLRDEKIDAVTDREIALLGLKGCSVCEKRSTGGPAVSALAEVLDETNLYGDRESFSEDAYTLLEALRQRGFYIAQRKTKDAE